MPSFKRTFTCPILNHKTPKKKKKKKSPINRLLREVLLHKFPESPSYFCCVIIHAVSHGSAGSSFSVLAWIVGGHFAER